jgi:uncharacterized iron-regulated membrane protein
VTAIALRRWRLVHTWSSLWCTLFLFVLCLTGLPLVFRDEIDDALAPRPRAPHLPVARAPQSLDHLLELARAGHPGRSLEFVFWDHDEPLLVGLGLGDGGGAGLEHMTRELLDVRTGETVGSEPAEGGLTEELAELHRNLCAGTAGDILLGLAAIAFAMSLVSGVVIYAPLLRQVGFGVVRTARSGRIYGLDLHNLAGMICLPWAVVVGATGFVNTLEAPLFAAWDSATMPALLAPYRDKPPITRWSSLDAAVETAKAACPDMQPTSVGLPASPFGTPRHYLIWMKGTTFFTSRLFTPVLVDAETGALALAKEFPWYLRLLEISRPLHFGDYGGLALKLLWGGLDLALVSVLGTGVYLWIRRLIALRAARGA